MICPPPSTERTIGIGSKYAPEFACYPLKLTLGNILESIERGADRVLMAGGIGPCRFGFYAQLQRVLVNAIGHEVEFIILEPPAAGIGRTLNALRKLLNRASPRAIVEAAKGSWYKCVIIDELERRAALLRAIEASPGLTDKVLEQCLRKVDSATELKEISETEAYCDHAFRSIPLTGIRGRHTVVGIIGEIFMVLDGFSNRWLERRLGRLKSQVVRYIRASEWLKSNILPWLWHSASEDQLVRAAAPYTAAFFGGHGRETVGGAALMSQNGVDGLIHVMPFTCMPEIAASAMLTRTEHDYGVPIMRLSLDEHTADAGLQTRLEAFVDMLAHRGDRQ